MNKEDVFALAVLALALAVSCCNDVRDYRVAGFHWKSEVYGTETVTVLDSTRCSNVPDEARITARRTRTEQYQCGMIPMQIGDTTMFNPVYCFRDVDYCEYSQDVERPKLLGFTEGMNRAVEPPQLVGRREDHCFVRFELDTATFVPADCSRWAEYRVGRIYTSRGVPVRL